MNRLASLDLARGLAVLGMIYVHLVGSRLAGQLAGKSAALFCLLAGMTWTLQHSPFTARRPLLLALFGALLHRFVWQTEVLVPLALMLLLTHALRRRGQKILPGALVLVLAAAPVLDTFFKPFFTSDWSEDGSHLADHAIGWATLRALALDGNYPLVPWLALPLLGSLAVNRGWLSRAPRFFVGALAVAAAAQFHASTVRPDAPDALQVTWVPTTLPFLLLVGGYAAALVAGLTWWESARGLPAFTRPLALLGRASLTHYVLHIVAVFAPLRLFYPAEDWSDRVGLLAFLGYLALAIPLTALWFRRFSHGPLESLWSHLSRPNESSR